MRSKLVSAILVVICIFAVMALPASAAPSPPGGGWTPTYYVLIDGTHAGKATVVYSDIYGVQVTRHDVNDPTYAWYTVKFVRPYGFLTADAYVVCTQDASWNCEEYRPVQPGGGINRITWMPSLAEWVIVPNYPNVMISLMVKP